MEETQVLLNDRQKEATLYTEGPLLILAGAGAGKTKTITERIVHIIEKGIAPSNILAVTFTNKAAKEMRERISNRLSEKKLIDDFDPYMESPTIKTFHGLGLQILSENASRLNLLKHPTILDSDDSLSIIKEAVAMLGMDPKLNDPSKIRGIISREKSDFVNQTLYEAKVASSQMETVSRVWKIYEDSLKKQRALDFDDLIVRSVHLLEDHAEVRDHYQKRFKYVHVDEYQDTNRSQYEFVKLLVDKSSSNICVVGDTDQNIYSWRGANLRNLMNFENDFPGAKIILLEENYRSTGNILRLANESIAKNTVRKEKVLFTSKGGGEFIEIMPAWDEESEAENIALKIKELLVGGVDGGDIAILYRANFQSRIMEEGMLKNNIPYNVLGTRFFERREIKDVMSYLRCALNRESHIDLKRVFETPKKGLGKVTVAKVFAGEPLPASASKKIHEVYNFLDKVQMTLETEPLSHVIQMIIVDTGLEKELLAGGSDDLDRLENIRELVSLTSKFDSQKGIDVIATFLEETSLRSDQDEDIKEKEGVRLMTIHSSKGLEFDYVFIAGLEHDLFPHKKIGNRHQSKEEEEEERRLFYVAVTRAKKRLYLSYAELRTIYGEKRINAPSEFLEDVPDEIANNNDLYYKGSGGGNVVYI